jgi:DNA-binding NtrC family response regulator
MAKNLQSFDDCWPQNLKTYPFAKDPMKKRILVVDDEESVRLSLKFKLKSAGFDVDVAADGDEALEKLKAKPADAVLLDIKMPRMSGIEALTIIRQKYPQIEVIVVTVVHDVKTGVECMDRGAFYYLTKPYQDVELIGLIDRALERKRLVTHNQALKLELGRRVLSENIKGQNKRFLEVLDLAARAAPTDSAVLIHGAVGTGKEMVADFIYNNSLRKEHPFLSLNCSSTPEPLLESELFGQERGDPMIGTDVQQGLLDLANGGTLFLDEIGEMPLPVQLKLLRFLETHEYVRAEGDKVPKCDVRLISATNRDLRKEVVAKRFLEDLLLHIDVVTLELPALRDRKDDIPLLAEHFLRLHAGNKEPKHLDEKAIELLMKYDWPGNIRELENVIERAAVLSRAPVIRADDLARPLEPGASF